MHYIIKLAFLHFPVYNTHSKLRLDYTNTVEYNSELFFLEHYTDLTDYIHSLNTKPFKTAQLARQTTISD